MPRIFLNYKVGGTIPMLSPALKSGGTRPPRPPPIDARVRSESPVTGLLDSPVQTLATAAPGYRGGVYM